LAMKEEKTTFVGRLATYRYYNMDQVVAMALKKFEGLRAGETSNLELP
ncbi:MAG: UDP-galactopyranose mutase, partial [Verrucomicrobiota bacterium]